MKVTFQTCCGVDVHKSFLVATIIKTSSGIEPSYQKRRFSTFNNSILEFKKWLLENECLYVCMESTGKYWIPVFNLLEDEINVTIANPKWVKSVKGNKDDTKDSKWIGDLFRLGLVRGSYIPCKKIRILREFTRYRYKLVSCRSSEKNRYQNALTVCNVALDSVVSDVFGKSSTSIIDYLLEQSGTSIDHEVIASKLLCCWAGLTPGSNESAGKKKSVRITRAGVYLKPALVQCAHAAVKSNKSPYYKKKYESLVKRRGKKRAIIAIAKMILTAIFQMLTTGETWNPCNLYKIDMPEALLEKQKQKAIKQAQKLLIQEGLLPPTELIAS